MSSTIYGLSYSYAEVLMNWINAYTYISYHIIGTYNLYIIIQLQIKTENNIIKAIMIRHLKFK